MEYTVQKLASLSGVSARTLRFYDCEGLLKPARINASGYRIYGSKEVEALRQILIYRELGLPLSEIKRILSSPGFNPRSALESHLVSLQQRRRQLDAIIENVKKSILEQEGLISMTDAEKFEALKQNLIEQNEAKYGDEIRKKYGDVQVDSSNRKFMGMSRKQYEEAERLSGDINRVLAKALETGDPSGPEAQDACRLHKRWLELYWPEYSPEAHAGLGRMYAEDSRFKAYYDAIAPGAAEFLCKAIEIFTKSL